MGRATEVFRQQETGAVEIALTAEWAANDFALAYLFYRRTNTNAITFEFRLETPEGDVVVIRKETGWVATNWFFGGPLPMRAGDKLIFTTTGAAGGEDHTAQILLKVGLH
jgi:hypothetical protein